MSIGGLLDSVTSTPTQTELTASTLLELLRNDRRRATITLMAAHNDPIDLRDLTEALADYEHGDYTTNQRKAAYTALYQTHLPKLDTTRVVEYNSDRQIIAPGPELQPVADIIAHIQQVTAEPDGDRA